TTYRLVVATANAESQFQRAGDDATPFTTADFEVWGADSGQAFRDLMLVRNGGNLELTFATVPEPASLLGLSAGAVALGAALRKRRASRRDPQESV
ncbi:MAG: PEP-CTERM sorting domain-containing protein, partial [Gemmataceae bacterium]